jgi:putative transposase
VHFRRNELTRMPMGDAQMVAAAVRTILGQSDAKHVQSYRRHRR